MRRPLVLVLVARNTELLKSMLAVHECRTWGVDRENMPYSQFRCKVFVVGGANPSTKYHATWNDWFTHTVQQIALTAH